MACPQKLKILKFIEIALGHSHPFAQPLRSPILRLLVQIFFDDHAPPHFHVRYAEHQAQINIQTLAIIHGTMPRRALSMIQEWGRLHQT